MPVMCLILDLKDDPKLIADYEKWHRPGGPPPAVNRSIRESGIEEMEIYRSGNRLIMMMRTNDAYSPDNKASADAADPDVIAWENLMWSFQQAIPWAEPGQKWIEAPRIYALSEQPD